MAFKISFQNWGGELDSIIVESESEIRMAIQSVVEEANDFYAGDKIIVTEISEIEALATA